MKKRLPSIDRPAWKKQPFRPEEHESATLSLSLVHYKEMKFVLLWQQRSEKRRGERASRIGSLVEWDCNRRQNRRTGPAPFLIDLEPVSVRQEHVSELSSLPDIHKDPFDRMLIAQARTEDMSLVTCDALIRAYPAVRILW